MRSLQKNAGFVSSSRALPRLRLSLIFLVIMSDSAASAPAPALPSGSHPLESSWTIWFDKKVRSPILRFVCISLCIPLCHHIFFLFLVILFFAALGVCLKNGGGCWLRRELTQVGNVQDIGRILGCLHASTACRRAAQGFQLSCVPRGYHFLSFVFSFFSHSPSFTSGYLPMWESFPFGGCWIIRVRPPPPPPSTDFVAFFDLPLLETESEIACLVKWFQ
jgi:hypothetical protein